MEKLFFKFLLGGVVLVSPLVSQEVGQVLYSEEVSGDEESMYCESEFRADCCRYRYFQEYQPSYTLQFDRNTSWPGQRQDSFVDALTR